jgi:2-keto-4-pentenoate hydratase/2-oxohepta-3-ene-1,7-dioic acid hydratase in catechol pathway
MAATCWARFQLANGQSGFGQWVENYIAEYRGDMFEDPKPTGRNLSRNEFSFLSPCQPTKILALWNNFHALAAKLGKAVPTHPLFLLKAASSIIGADELIRRPASYPGRILYEGELGIVIGRRCKEVSVESADTHIFGYTCINDVTAASVLDENPDFAQWCRSKSYDTFSCVGPVIATEFDWREARVVTRLDGVERQNYALSDLIFSPPEIVSRASQDMTLLPGDVIACGTSLGVGVIKDGSRVEVQIAGIGSLTNSLG